MVLGKLTRCSCFGSVGVVASCRRWMSSSLASTSLKYVNVKQENEYAVISMNRPPVNAFNLPFVDELTHILRTLEDTDSVRGIIITSSLNIFGGGLDISELHDATKDEQGLARLRRFCTVVVDFASRFYTTPLVTMAAINGAAPAGGCALANVLDYRIMVDDKQAVIGLNESHLGVPVPVPAANAFKNIIGHRGAEQHLCLGTLMQPKDALKLGLVDAVVPSHDLMGLAIEEMERWLRVPDEGRIRTKLMLRKRCEDENRRVRERFLEVICDANTQETIAKYYGTLRGKK